MCGDPGVRLGPVPGVWRAGVPELRAAYSGCRAVRL